MEDFINERRQSDGWYASETFGAYAERSRQRHDYAEVAVDNAGDINIRIEGGSGYDTYAATTSIPHDVMVEVMRRAGYAVTRIVDESESHV